MYFSNPRSISKNITIQNNSKPNNIMMGISVRPKPTTQPRPKPTIQTQETVVTKTDEMKWGAPTWFFFHTIAEKIKPECFLDNRKSLFSLVQTICSNLPCPTCSQHAKQYIEKININSVKNKEEFAMLFCSFHNEVNARKNKPIYEYNKVHEKYSKANFMNIINNFMYYYKMEHHAVRMIADNMFRRRIAKSMLDWIHANLHIFEMQ